MPAEKPKPFIKAALTERIQKWPKLLQLCLNHHHVSRTIERLETHVQARRLERNEAIDAARALYETLVDNARQQHDPEIPLKVFQYTGSKRTLQGILGYDPFPPEFLIDLEHSGGKHIIRVRSEWGAGRVEIIPKEAEE